ncbi:MAG: TonB-dependent receptor [Balneolales bacterium]
MILPLVSLAQDVFISGSVSNKQSSEPLIGANVILYSIEDTSLYRGISTDAEGSFLIRNITPDDYMLSVSFIGLQTLNNIITIGKEPLTGLNFSLVPGSISLDLTVTGRLPAVEVKGDTTQYNAGAYRMNRDASAEELLLRMPGFVIVDGQVQAQGEAVQRVLVDGEEFFGDDARIALNNLPADIIDKIELFDRQSDQARFTGFEDDNPEKTVNIVTRPGMNKGSFGRGEAGMGTDTRYMGGGNLNYFRDKQRISMIGLTNNINQLNFSTEDMQDVSGGGRRGGSRNFRSGGQNGLNVVHSLGLNYIDTWSDQWSINGNYFFNARANTNEVDRERRYIMARMEDQQYDENSYSDSDNFNHRMGMRMEYDINDDNSFVFRTRLGATQNQSLSSLDGFTLSPESILLNEILNENHNDTRNLNFSQSILYRHRLAKEGRTFSIDIDGDINRNTGDQSLLGESVFYDGTGQPILDDQITDIYSNRSGASVNLSYTEPLGEETQFMVRYNPSWDRDFSDRETWLSDANTGDYTTLDSIRTNRYENDLHRQVGGVRLRRNMGAFRVNLNFDYEYTRLQGEQEFPFVAGTWQTYSNLMPGASLRVELTEASNLRINYYTRTRTPSASQLQNVIDNTNQLRLRGGNPDLRQQYSHTLYARYNISDREKGSSTYLNFRMTRNDDHVSQRTYIAENDSLVQEGVILRSGAQLVIPENAGTSWNYGAYVSRGMPINSLKSNLNLNAGANYNRTPSFVNEDLSQTNQYGMNAGFSFSSNISRMLDFRINYTGSYQFVDQDNPTRASITPEDDYYTGRAGFNFNLETGFGLTFRTDWNLRHNIGLSDDFNRSTMGWNASAGYKFLTDKVAEIKITAADLLNRNDDINRIINESYIEDVRSDVLSRFFLVTLSYRFRSFPAGSDIPGRGRDGGMRGPRRR